ncbi:uncharacterized protein LOC118277130 [Spodoptera frugiperda]|uniref:Uncharacterized protein LOC118277130 n=1 Tax=Spodoptera frugiperda TaxID=7108 RepID=A0A9R0EQP7_SPOFR|nr:uncharacterized protein LOC118277130 [Spodoptera frugiperda]XP_035451723.1 uncharacterized protein LOC118277130 [Spodoptera frugiperda]XP_035451724.1 uncharacterized protein LOC118277130 [Spodoptera frugiperda]
MAEQDEARARSDDEADGNSSSSDQPATSGSKSVVMPCTSTTDSMGREYSEPTRVYTYFTDEESNESEDQTRYLTVTYTAEDTAEEIATATLIIKRQDHVDQFLPFVGALLRSIQDEQIKLKLMEDISQILINAKTEEIQRMRYQL